MDVARSAPQGAHCHADVLDAVLCLTHAINAHLNKGCKAFKAVFLDYSNAFDTLPQIPRIG